MLSLLKRCGIWNVVIFFLLLVFTIGLNLGIHGALHFNAAHGPEDVTTSKVHSRTTEAIDRTAIAKTLEPIAFYPLTATTVTVPQRITERPITVNPTTPKPNRVPYTDEPNKGPIGSFIQAGGKFPILLITCNRPELLKGTLNSLLAVADVTTDDILVVQDGSMAAVSEVVKNRNIRVIQNIRGVQLRGGAGADGASRIATHYKFALSTAFQEYPDAPGVIVVEDDLLFSPDFMEYFQVAGPVLDHDKSVFAISAWNDNGFIGRVKDPYKLERTDYFPGLGWLISRELYSNELEPKWPRAHWDHWLRSEETNKNREIVHPEVPRTFHNGIKGTFMDLTMHNLYFRDIAYNTNPMVSWSDHQQELGRPLYQDVVSDRFEAEVAHQIEQCAHAGSVDEIISAPAGTVLCVWINVAHEMATSNPPFKPISSFFGLWHEHRRGAHRGMHRFYFHDKLILLINIKFFSKNMGSYASLKPTTAVVIPPQSFLNRKLSSEALPAEMIKKIVEVPATSTGLTCTQVCESKSLNCFDRGFSAVNTCSKLKSYFPCTQCFESYGAEQPAYVSPLHTENAGSCLYTSDPSSSMCSSMHAATQRLCPCV